MIQRRFGLLLLLAVASCAAPQAEPQGSSPIAKAPVSSNDMCGAGALQNLVGRPRTEIPVAVDPSRRRVTCTTCPVTMDFNPERLNIFFDQATGIIKEVKCG